VSTPPLLASFAVSSQESAPEALRAHPEPSHPFRSPFQRDRDRVLHARAFRRLAGKTQVFTRRFSDHLRSRLTHTLEVTQIARTIARALYLNEDLVETLALVHDIGHPPFGHAGERALDEALSTHNLAFDHNLHALRIVDYFEQRYAAFPGINLTLAVREGIIKHSRDYKSADHPELAAYHLDSRPPLEAQLIDLADEIAYLTADLDDGVESGLIDLDHALDHLPLLAHYYRIAREAFPDAWSRLLLNEAVKQMLNALVEDLVTHTQSQLHKAGIVTLEDVRRFPARLVAFSPQMEQVRRNAKRYLSQALYNNPELEQEKLTAQQVIAELFDHWMRHPEALPLHQQENIASEGLPRAVSDYMAGMTDAYILRTYEDLLGRDLPGPATR
jgi:dGTPase